MNATPLRTVLYVDDEPDIREIVQIALGLTQGLTVHSAQSGEQALAFARELRPDLVLLDVMMPGLDGPATLVGMRKHPDTAAIPVIFMTAQAMPKEIALLMEIGALGVIAKPFDPMGLSAQVRSLWEKQPAKSPRLLNVADSTALQQHMRDFGERFLQRTRDEAVRFNNLIEVIHSGDIEKLEELKNMAHRIRGAGSTFGFAAISACAGEIERLVDGFKESHASSTPITETKTRRQLAEWTQRLSREVEQAALR